MKTSDELNELAAALVVAQAEIGPAALDSVNPFLKNKYASLGAIFEASKPALERNGLSITQFATTEENSVGVTTLLLHKSGQYIQDTITLPLGDEKGKSLAQVAGSIITYMRRYSWTSVLAMYADEDVDGNEPAPTRKPKKDPVVEEGKRLGGVTRTSAAEPSQRNWGEFYAKVKEKYGLEASQAQAKWAESFGDHKAYTSKSDDELMEALG